MRAVYILYPYCDNPFFDGLGIDYHPRFDPFHSRPQDFDRDFFGWKPLSLASHWKTPVAKEPASYFADYLTINLLYHAFSQKAVDLIGEELLKYGELLPIKNGERNFYYYNRLHIADCVDLEKTGFPKFSRKYKYHFGSPYKSMIFHADLVEHEVVFINRTDPVRFYCTQLFVDLVNAKNLQGFCFIKVWPLAEGERFAELSYQAGLDCRKIRPFGTKSLDIIGNSVVILLYSVRSKLIKKEIMMGDEIESLIEKELGFPYNSRPDYFGSVYGHEVFNDEYRITLSCPDCDGLVTKMMPVFQALPWQGKYQVAKSRTECNPYECPTEYIHIEKTK